VIRGQAGDSRADCRVTAPIAPLQSFGSSGQVAHRLFSKATQRRAYDGARRERHPKLLRE